MKITALICIHVFYFKSPVRPFEPYLPHIATGDGKRDTVWHVFSPAKAKHVTGFIKILPVKSKLRKVPVRAVVPRFLLGFFQLGLINIVTIKIPESKKVAVAICD